MRNRKRRKNSTRETTEFSTSSDSSYGDTNQDVVRKTKCPRPRQVQKGLQREAEDYRPPLTTNICDKPWHPTCKWNQPLNLVVGSGLRYYGMKISLCFKIKVCFNFIFFHKINTTNQNQFIEIFKVCMPLHFWFFLWIILMATASYHGKDLFCLFLLFFFTINYYMATQVSLVLFNQYHQILDSPCLYVLTLYLVIICLSCVQYLCWICQIVNTCSSNVYIISRLK